MRKIPKRLDILYKIPLIMVVLLGLQLLQVHFMPIGSGEKLDALFLASEYIIERNHWGHQWPDRDAPGKIRMAKIYLSNEFLNKSDNQLLLTRLARRFPESFFPELGKPNSLRTEKNTETEVAIKIQDVSRDASNQVIVSMEIHYQEPFGGSCGESPRVVLKHSFFNSVVKPELVDRFISSACQ